MEGGEEGGEEGGVGGGEGVGEVVETAGGHVREFSQGTQVEEIREGGGGGGGGGEGRMLLLVADKDVEGDLSTCQGGAEAVVVVSERLVVLEVRGSRGRVLGKSSGGSRGGRGDYVSTYGAVEGRFTLRAVIPRVGAQAEGAGATGGSEKRGEGRREGRREGGR